MAAPPSTPDHVGPSELTVLFDTFVLDRAVSDLLATTMRDAALSPLDYAFYSAVEHEPDISPSDLAARLGVPRATMTDWLRTVEGRGHASRRRSDRDGRRWCVRLTRSGLRAHAEAREAFGVAYLAFLRNYAGSPSELGQTLRSAAAAARAATAEVEMNSSARAEHH